MSSAYRHNADYSNFTADQLRTAAQRVASDLARASEMGKPRPEYVEQEQDLKTYLLREAERRS